MKRPVSLILMVLVILSLTVPSYAADVTASAFKAMFLYEAEFYGFGDNWREGTYHNGYSLTREISGQKYILNVNYERRNGTEWVESAGLFGPFSELKMDYDPYTEYGSGNKPRQGLKLYTAFMYAVYDLGIMPDMDNTGNFEEAGLLSPYSIYIKMFGDEELYYDRNTWQSVIHENGRLNARHRNGVTVIVTGEPGGEFSVYVWLK